MSIMKDKRYQSSAYAARRAGIKNDHGFAIVLALALMSFIFLLLVSLSMLLSLELQASEQRTFTEKARQNTLFSLAIAIGDIQRHAGQDRRATGRADILDEGPDTVEAVGVLNPHWTGIWNETGQLETWLVSGRDLGDEETIHAQTWAEGANSVLLESSETVMVPAYILNENNLFAYWVADEGVKAKLATGAYTPDAEFVSSQRFGIEFISGMEWFTSSAAVGRNILSLNSMKLLPGGSTLSPSQFHNLTTHGMGVLANHRDGGLKTDLTLSLFEGSLPTGALFPPALSAGATIRDPGGPSWQQLAHWANATPTVTSGLTVEAPTNERSGTYPVLSAAQVYFLPNNRIVDENAIYLHLMPAIVLWNPYNSRLDTADYRVQMGRAFRDRQYYSSLFEFVEFFVDWRMRVWKEGEYPGPLPVAPPVMIQDPQEHFPLVFDLPSVSLEPGEAVVFSPPSGHNLYSYEENPAYGNNRLEAGYRSQWSYYTRVNQNITNVQKDSAGNFHASVEYDYRSLKNLAFGVRLLKREGGTFLPLSDSVMMSTYADAPPYSLMPSFTLGDPIDDLVRQSNAIGPKVVRNYVDNEYSPFSVIPRETYAWLSNHNPRGFYNGPNPITYTRATSDIGESSVNNPSFVSSYQMSDIYQDTGMMPVIGNNVGVGLSEGGNIFQTTLFEGSPGRERLHSVGQLMHAPLFNWGNLGYRPRSETGLFDNLIPAYPVGNSKADPRIRLGETYTDWQSLALAPGNQNRYSYDGIHYDYSYLLNETLWDSYFFSSFTNDEPVNRRLRVVENVDETSLNKDIIAGYMMVDGAFNINSTSVEAWKALLGSFFNSDTISDESAPRTSSFLRMLDPIGGGVSGATDTSNDTVSYNGYRQLLEEEIEVLAEAIVEEVKWRGPFTDLASFVNRNLERDAPDPLDIDAFRLEGVLSAAISRSEINESLHQNTVTTSGLSPMETKAERGWLSENIPGWLSQADLMARLGSVLTPRSDVFKIRAYGEFRNPVTGEIESNAWCEATVQRIPTYVSGAAAETALGALTDTDSSFGRKFVVVDFRWLGEGEL